MVTNLEDLKELTRWPSELSEISENLRTGDRHAKGIMANNQKIKLENQFTDNTIKKIQDT